MVPQFILSEQQKSAKKTLDSVCLAESFWMLDDVLVNHSAVLFVCSDTHSSRCVLAKLICSVLKFRALIHS